MSLQKYRADTSTTQADGATLWFARWMGGPSLAKIAGCRVDGIDKRLTVYITGEPDTYFSQPAATRYRGRYIAGYVTSDDGVLYFCPMDRHKSRLTGGAFRL
jgi:hypothetical protein